MGYGHRSAAHAVEIALHNRYAGQVETRIENAFDHPSVPGWLKEDPANYNRMVKERPELYQKTYQALNKPLPTTFYELGLTVVLGEAVANIVRATDPQVIVATHPNYLAPLKTYYALSRRSIPVVTAVTDMGDVHVMWFNDVSSFTLVPTQSVYDTAIENKLDPGTVRITGIPVNPALGDDTRPKAEVRAALGLEPERTTVLVSGSQRVNNLMNAVRLLNHSSQPIQLLIVAGGDDETYEALQTMEWHLPVRLFNFTNDMPTLMRAADAIVCKAGGLMVTESLAAGLPLLLIDVIEGQETGNAEFVVNHQAGLVVKDPLDFLEAAYDWLSGDQEPLRAAAACARAIGRPRAAYDAAELAWGLAHEKASPS
jgi:1,2-diacylglycerol 3-beta-galactosyltransferase